MNEKTRAETGRGFLARRRRALMAGAVALGLTGVLAAEGVLLPQTSTPAAAQTATTSVQPGVYPSFADVVEQVSPAVVSVRVKSEEASPSVMRFEFRGPNGEDMQRFFRQFGLPFPYGNDKGRRVVMGQGSGFFISADGYLVTNNHVVDNAKEVTIITHDGKSYDAKVIGTDEKTDLALLKVDADRAFPYVRFAHEPVRIGDWVIAVGNPFGLGGTVTAGIVSASGRNIGEGPYDDFIQIDAPINKGNSGGPTFNLKGEVVGVNTAIFSPSGGSVGIGFAIPASVADPIIADLKDDGTVTRGYIGVRIQPVTEDIANSLGLKEARGALVAEPQEGSAADRAGIEAGDVILAVNGQTVEDPRDLALRISTMKPGSEVTLRVWRDGREREFTVRVQKMDSELRTASLEDGGDLPENARLGLQLGPSDGADGGLVVTGIDDEGPAADSGINVGDVILQAGDRKVNSVDDIRQAMAEARKQGRNAVLLRVRSGKDVRFVAVPFNRA